MRKRIDPRVEDGRIREGYYGTKPNFPCGAFVFRLRGGVYVPSDCLGRTRRGRSGLGACFC